MNTDHQNSGLFIAFLESFFGKWLTYSASIICVLLLVDMIPGIDVRLFYVIFTFSGFLGTILHFINFAYWYLSYNYGLPKRVVMMWVVGMALQLAYPIFKWI